jgi:hypothetical protein
VSLSQIAASALGIATGAVLAINGAFMLVSPRAWFKLPYWLRGTGALTERRYTSGLRGLGVQLLGAVLLTFVGGILYDVYSVNDLQRAYFPITSTATGIVLGG